MQYKKNIKIIIDKRKLDLLLRLNCPKEILMDLILENKLTLTGDSLIDDNLESLIDIKEFKNWGGNHNPTGINQHTKKRGQVDQEVDQGQNIGQVVDKDIDKDKEIDIDNVQYSNPDIFSSAENTKLFKMYQEYCYSLIPLGGYKSKRLRESAADFLKDINYDFEYIKTVFCKANDLKTICDQPIDLQKIINNHERIASDYYKKMKINQQVASGQIPRHKQY